MSRHKYNLEKQIKPITNQTQVTKHRHILNKIDP